MKFIVLYCTVLYCTVLYCTVLYYTVLYCTVLYCTVLYCSFMDKINMASPPTLPQLLYCTGMQSLYLPHGEKKDYREKWRKVVFGSFRVWVVTVRGKVEPMATIAKVRSFLLFVFLWGIGCRKMDGVNHRVLTPPPSWAPRRHVEIIWKQIKYPPALHWGRRAIPYQQ